MEPVATDQMELADQAKDYACDERPDKDAEKETCCAINRNLLPLKTFYFFFYGACGAVIPFVAVFMKSLNLTAAETGVVTGASVLGAAFIRTGIGVAADKMAARKAFLLISCVGFGTAFFFLWFIPPRASPALPAHNTSRLDSPPGTEQQTTQVWVCLASNGSQLCRFPPSPGHTPCQLRLRDHPPLQRRPRKRDVIKPGTSPLATSNGRGGSRVANAESPLNQKEEISQQSSGHLTATSPSLSTSDHGFQLQGSDDHMKQTDTVRYFYKRAETSAPCFMLADSKMDLPPVREDLGDASNIRDSINKSEPTLTSQRQSPVTVNGAVACLPGCELLVSTSTSAGDSPGSRYHAVRENPDLTSHPEVTRPKDDSARPEMFTADSAFLVSFILVTTARSFYSSATSLADAVTYTVLGPRSSKWGRQRMWGTVGTALAVITATNINDRLQGNNFTALFFICLGLSLLAFCVGGVFLRADKSPQMSSVSQDVSHLLSDGAVRLFLLKLIAYGIMCGTAQNFFLWFLVDLGSEQTTLGLCVAVHCLSSVFILRFSSRIFKLVSHATVIYIVLAAYVVRFLAFSFLTHAWSALPLELLHGVTYSLMWAAASSTANQMALPGTQASCQAIAGAVYWDLGRGLGNLLTGQLMQVIGGRWTFRVYAGTCALLLPFFWLLDQRWPISRRDLLPVLTREEDFSQESEVGKSDFKSTDNKLAVNNNNSSHYKSDKHIISDCNNDTNISPNSASSETISNGLDSIPKSIVSSCPSSTNSPDFSYATEGMSTSPMDGACLLQPENGVKDGREGGVFSEQ